MQLLSDKVLAVARSAFSGDPLDEVVMALSAYGVQPHEPEVERVQLAILELARGDGDRIRQLVKVAKVDYRDVLAWQQLGPLPLDQGQALQAAAREVIKNWGKP